MDLLHVRPIYESGTQRYCCGLTAPSELTRSHPDSTPQGMGTKSTILTTIGYEAAELDDFVATLLAAGITRLIDVRELPISRRRGFAKRALSEALADAGIVYVHLRGLGDPKEGREAARVGDLVR